jgi:outer membrane lipoprotein LolB
VSGVSAGIWRWLVVVVALVLAGCATPPRDVSPSADRAGSGPWSGRLALQVENQPSQSFSAAFELKGNAQSGELALYGPLGSTLAVLSWQPGQALLNANGQTRQFPSVDDLIAHVTGAAVPVNALFDWLRGIDTAVQGWRADLSRLAQGRLAARRTEPPPQADLNLVLEQ